MFALRMYYTQAEVIHMVYIEVTHMYANKTDITT